MVVMMTRKKLISGSALVHVALLTVLLAWLQAAVGQSVTGQTSDSSEFPCSKYIQQSSPYKIDQVAGRQIEITVERHEALLLLPEDSASNSPLAWVWFAPMVPGEPNQRHGFIIQHVLSAGMAFAAIDVGELYGSPEGTRLYTEFHDVLRRCFNLSSKAVLLPQSRGGLMLFNWAALHPDEVVRIAGIYPVCDLRSYPGLTVAAKAYDMSEAELSTQLEKHNPINLMSALAGAHVPLLIIHGDNDKIVPLQDNSAVLVQRYRQLGGPTTLIVVPGKGHEEVDEFFRSSRFVRFLITGS
jgi:hypothetical protein